VTDAANTAPATRGGFPEVRPVADAPPELGRFVAALHRLQDLTVSTRPDSAVWAAAAERVENACGLLDGHQVPEVDVVAGRVLSLPGLGHPLLPPWTMTSAGPDGVTMAGHFSQSHVGGNQAVHGGMIPLLYDWLFGDGRHFGGHSPDSHRVSARRLPQDHPDRGTADGPRPHL
jgi:hypothetical protein